MALEELIRQREDQQSSQTLPASAEVREKTGLIHRLQSLAGQTGTGADASAEPEAFEAPRACADGYVRRSPEQTYRSAEDLPRRRTRKIVTAVIVLIIAGLLLYALMRSGLLVFRLR